nr:PREDICTED: protein cycle isoform X1 [Bemisia tabaci]XP_018917517.1 PREDICTED: protein cycle isoform X1 [Bemisia tabaci]XP_018917518.1 PREDICTED: protein cycle isoform X1 [Bemisia tabaci]XP_018917519.1 PREDICTED: protein cycle isoform X1 [Bemisia tabaci]
MVARNFFSQDISSYTRHLQTCECEDEPPPPYLSLDQLKQQQHPGTPSESSPHPAAAGTAGAPAEQNVYYDLQPVSQSNCSASMYIGSGAGSATAMPTDSVPIVDSSRGEPKKRKSSYHGSDLDNDTDDAKSARTDDCKKQNHSEIEKRRRDKMNTYITELSAMVPMCHFMSRKLDKLTVLRMAVQHLKSIRSAVHSYTEGSYKPSFLSDQELKHLILQAAEGFLFVVGCDRGRILYVSESVSQILSYSQGDLLGQSWFDILHPKDVDKVKEQLSSSDLSPRERLIDAKTMLPVRNDAPQEGTRLCPGSRRSFICRMKCKLNSVVKEEVESNSSCHRRKKQQFSDKRYSVIQCTGYLKSWAPAKVGLEEQESDAEAETCNLSCLVAIGRSLPQLYKSSSHQLRHNTQPIQFISRHAIDGKFLFVDQRATLVLGFLPQELLGTSMYEYYHHEDIPNLAESHKEALKNSVPVTTKIYRFRNKDEKLFVRLQSEWKSFRNPWTKDVEYLIAKNFLVISDSDRISSNIQRAESAPRTETNSFECFSNSQTNGHNNMSGRDMTRLISSHVEASKIGRQIAEAVLDMQRRGEESSPSNGTPSPAEVTEVANILNDIRQGASRDAMSTIYNLVNEGQALNTTQPINGANHDLDGMRSTMLSNSSIPLSNYTAIRNNVTLSSSANSTGEQDDVLDMMDSVSPEQSGPNDCNDEAAMAVIMSLLEADAGLGGPVDFSGLPWPLP